MGGFYMQYLESLCRRRGWTDPWYECSRGHSGYTCLVLVNGREYQTDLAYASDTLAQENAAMRAFMVCRNFSVNGGMLARNGIVQGLPADEASRTKHKSSGGSRRQGGGGGGWVPAAAATLEAAAAGAATADPGPATTRAAARPRRLTDWGRGLLSKDQGSSVTSRGSAHPSPICRRSSRCRQNLELPLAREYFRCPVFQPLKPMVSFMLGSPFPWPSRGD
ncbi:hypothetical protein MAPG_05406 [Magnaporthiopsis poae ATCC 64411]|uniref:DRBM domain-containing protein n=1 Tax=Magnaporthiopsis poae (strain ATCC 64411 / 73-15) TaxID=644358 RepID=A0A0C4DZB1_MAGP6|nr:hypothetical protein MAPG_05406 [Magnaporthiopsis poae ATCC 64411]